MGEVLKIPARAAAVSSGSGTLNTLPRFGSGGLLADSAATDDGTTFTIARDTLLLNTGTSVNFGSTRSRISSPADKSVLIRGGAAAGTDNRLAFGGTGSGNCYILQNGTDFIFRSSTTDAPTGVSLGQLSVSNTSFRAIQGNAAGAGLSLGSTGQVVFTNNTLGSAGSIDSGIARSAAAVLRFSNGSTGLGMVLAGTLVEANTAGVGSPNVLTDVESGTLLTNEGTTAVNYHTLPTAAANVGPYTFVCQDADGIRIVANTGDTVRIFDKVSGAAGYAESTTIGSTVTFNAINATEWVAVSALGTWSVV